MENSPSRDAAQAEQFDQVMSEIEKTIDRVARGIQGEDHPLVDRAQNESINKGLDVENDDDDDNVTIQPRYITRIIIG